MKYLIWSFLRSAPPGVRIAVAVGIFGFIGLIGFLSLFFPRTLVGKEKTGIWGFIGGVVSVFPNAAQLWVARAFGLVLMGISACLIAGVVSRGVQTESDYYDETDEQAPYEYKEKVAREFNALNSTYKASVTDAGILILQEPSSGKFLAANVDDDYLYFSAAKTAQGILEKIAKEPASIPQVQATPASPVASNESSLESQLLSKADQLLQEANDKWKAKEYDKSLESAEKALSIRKSVLGEKHEKVIQIQNMIDAAKKMLPAQTK